ncbi:hypothetical protein [Solimonas terrae]|uniref:Uncharacterized protein n=1 Tax=Solimonas terrae TaxID=1396819 RepID=A0A6M2BNK1_9GAMM|nr:hypothetical protein [Solimonas terrae]NGY04048.1 hypothetical protein [Solimonas terrae]
MAISKPIHKKLNPDRAYSVYPVTFTGTQQGKVVVYKGTRTLTLHKAQGSWQFTGDASARGVNGL